MQQVKMYLIIASISTLSACAHLNLPKKVESISESSNAIQEHKLKDNKKTNLPPSSFKLSGAIAVKNKDKGWNASLNWHQNGPQQYNIRLSGPLGGKTVIIDKQNSLITYRDGTKTIKSKSGEDLLRKEAHINLPVNDLYYWVRGIEAPGKVQMIKKNQNGQIETLKQAGFIITYGRYMTDSHGNILPSKIRLQGQDITIKMVIKSWG